VPSAHELHALRDGGLLGRRRALNAAAVAVALSAAVAFGWSTALMHHSASRAPQDGKGLLSLLRHLLFQPRWLIGMVASLGGLGLHAYALKLGSIAVVQPLVVTGLVFAFLFRALLDRHLPSRALIGWVLLTAVGIALFLIGARSVSSSSEPSGRSAAVFLVIGATTAATTWRSSSRFGRNHAGLLLGLSGGIVFGLIAGVLKTVTGADNLLAVLTNWPLYCLLALGCCGFLINQHAYSRAPLASSLPVLNVVNPAVAVLFGIVVFDERPSGQPLTVVTELIGLVLVLVGIFFLARQEDQPPLSIAVQAELHPGQVPV
jgi:drug/metabolite transporter (DMT)-like permease